MNNIRTYLAILGLLSSCSNYLDVKPDAGLATIERASELYALLDNEFVMHAQIITGEDLADNYYVLDQTWNASGSEIARNKYIYSSTENDEVGWSLIYEEVYYTNVVLERVEELRERLTPAIYNEIKGTALFYRSLAFFEALTIFSMPYRVGENEDALGIPLRTTADVNISFPRAAVGACYRKIFEDLAMSVDLLPSTTAVQTRPSKRAARALQARVAFDIADYERAFAFAQLVLQEESTLLNFATINHTAALPFDMYNIEVIHYTNRFSEFLAPQRSIVDSVLYASYTDTDYRKRCYFQFNADANAIFKGSFLQARNTQFTGLSTSEMYLTCIESALRTNREEAARQWLEPYFRMRYMPTGIPNMAISTTELLALVQSERRKELIYRNRRWSDIRRRNLDGENIVLQRRLNGQLYRLEPNSLGYALPIPLEAIRYGGIEQNMR
ncbi:RagB/SusD family nutrient uptake outer membrane protein [Sphingobacterium paludis]|uniref:SusD-like starch-binding protein associating with outer membrane n=1 Tax=Sphingobacterium paludis TaxID=1476465 RepID=A0A4R7CVA6_9SPHI|nr:RagB/SusD family nutrient uptake outer membrane protein [Sphingobacterium paludis]TDS12339.1 SusD-like starch-binding protein associating with outer membrane [Sphingobacterium paludis]